MLPDGLRDIVGGRGKEYVQHLSSEETLASIAELAAADLADGGVYCQ